MPHGSDLDRAAQLLELGRAEEARGLLEAGEVSSAPALLLLARACRELDDHAGTLAAASKAIALDSGEETSHRLFALAAIELDRAEEAMSHARKAVRLAPRDHLTHMVLATVLSRVRAVGLSKPPLAETWLAASRAVQLEPGSADAHVVLGQVALRQGWLDTSERENRKALEIDPQHAAALNNLAVIDLRQMRLTNAGNQLDAALAAGPEDGLPVRNIEALALELLRNAGLVLLGSLVPLLVLTIWEYPGGRTWLWPYRLGVAGALVVVWAGLVVWTLSRLRSGIRGYFLKRAFRRPRVAIRAFPNVVAVVGIVGAGVLPTPTATICALAAGTALAVGRLIGINFSIKIDLPRGPGRASDS